MPVSSQYFSSAACTFVTSRTTFNRAVRANVKRRQAEHPPREYRNRDDALVVLGCERCKHSKGQFGDVELAMFEETVENFRRTDIEVRHVDAFGSNVARCEIAHDVGIAHRERQMNISH